MRLIDADALIEDIKSFWDWDSIDGVTATTVLKQTMTDISHAPTIDAQPIRRAKWLKREYWSEGIGMGEDWGHYYECSACGKRIKGHDMHLDDYCKKCGAEMDKSEQPKVVEWFQRVLDDFNEEETNE